MNDRKIREIVAMAYWQAHTDGRLCGKNGKIDFGLAALSIEAIAIELGCKPAKVKKVGKS